MSFSNVSFYDNIKLDNVHAQNVKLDYDELITEDYRFLVAGSNLEFSGEQISTYQSYEAEAIDSTASASRILVSFSNITDNGSIIIVDGTGAALSARTEVRNTYDINESPLYLKKITSTTFMIVYSYNQTECRARIVTIDASNNITLGTAVTFSTNHSKQIDLDLLDSNNMIVTWKDESDGYGKSMILSISGTSVSANTEYTFTSTDQIDKLAVSTISSSRAAVIYQKSTGGGYIKILEISSTIIATTNPEVNFNASGTSTELDILLYSSNIVCIVYSYFPNAYVYLYNVANQSAGLIDSNNFETSASFNQVRLDSIDNRIILHYNRDGVSFDSVYYQIFTISNNQFLVEQRLALKIRCGSLATASFDTYIFSIYEYISITPPTERNACNLLFSIGESTEKIDFEQIWDFDTSVFLADFEGNLEAGNIQSGGEIITGWRIKRKAEDIDLFYTLADLDTSVISYIDYRPRNNINYTYAIFSVSASGESLGIEESGSIDFFGWFLTDNTNTYKFDIGWDGLKSSSINTNQDVHLYKNYTKYPVPSFGPRNYRTGSITAIPYTGDYEINLTVLDEIREFIDDKEEKWLKNTAGEIFKVITSGFRYKYLDKPTEQPHDITFEYSEVAEGEGGLDGN